MNKLIISFLSSALILFPAFSFASQFPTQADEITALNSLPGSKTLLKSTGSGCVRWEQRCRPNTFFPERTDCTSECVEYQDDSSGSYQPSYSGGGGDIGELSPFGWAVAIVGLAFCGWLLWSVMTGNSL